MTLDEVVDSISAQKGCESAMKVFRDCQLTASGDVQLGAAVEKKCEAHFMPGLKATQKQAYQRELRICDGSTGINPAPYTRRLQRSAGRRSPSVTRGER
ncbi:hypothetical protein [Bradyrhizobium sp. 143]|uniref:hypothetical protein n=1 Tax=unclassified Bradyrhizobium TaxID=2631580 RepID=UPI003208D707